MTTAHVLHDHPADAAGAVSGPASAGPRAATQSREREQLLPLTSLRFVAAALVVFGHSRGAFGLSKTAGGERFAWWHAVPFFFVLSGFILTHAYPRLDGPALRSFLVARVARLWPAHAVCFAATAALMAFNGVSTTLPIALGNLFMLHAWVPYSVSYFSFNAASWSISTELGLYLMFPLLLANFGRTWLPKALLAFGLYLFVCYLGRRLGWPQYLPPEKGPDVAGLMLNPLSYVYLFVSGMTASLAWRWLSPRVTLGRALGTALELAALAGVIWIFLSVSTLWKTLVWVFPAVSSLGLRWVPDVHLLALTFPLLILVIALRQGWVSRALSSTLLVTLGEISYSLYLCHGPMRRALETAIGYSEPFRAWWASMPPLTTGLLYWSSCLLAAWALWRFVENPARRRVRAWWRDREATISDRQWRARAAGVATLMGVVFVSLLVTIH